MILIFSNKGDYDTNTVVKWINHYGGEFIRINTGDRFRIRQIDMQTEDIVIESQNQQFNLKDIRTVWYRRGAFLDLAAMPEGYVLQTPELEGMGDMLEQNLLDEYKTYSRYLKYVMEQKRCLTRFTDSEVNKLIVLSMARQLGLQVPDSWIATENDQITDISPEFDLITKSVSSGIYHHTPTRGYYTYTESVSPATLEASHPTYFPTLVQRKVRKRIELRIFFLEDQFYPMAIFSQFHNLSSVDNRKGAAYNRWVPYQLPTDIQDKLHALMQQLGFLTGSIDLLVTEEEEYIFLEVNPVGQIGMTSYPCNYQLHQKIAQWLLK